jgi:hypothetical protein
MKKYCRGNLFSALQNGEVIQDRATNHYFLLSGLAQPFIN